MRDAGCRADSARRTRRTHCGGNVPGSRPSTVVAQFDSISALRACCAIGRSPARAGLPPPYPAPLVRARPSGCAAPSARPRSTPGRGWRAGRRSTVPSTLDRVELRRAAELLERGEHAGADALGLGVAAGGAQAAPADPGVEGPDRAAVVVGRPEDGRVARQRAQAVGAQHVRRAQPRRRPPRARGPRARPPTAASRAASRRPARSCRRARPPSPRARARRAARAAPRRAAPSARRPTAAPARAGPRARPPGCRRRPAARRARCRRARRMPPWSWAETGSIASRQPCWESAPQVPARAAHEAAAALERAREPLARRAPRVLELVRRARGRPSPPAARGTTRSRRTCRSRRTGPRAASPTRRTARAAASRNSWPILPGSSSVPGMLLAPLQPRRARAASRAPRPAASGSTCSEQISESRPNSAWKRPGSPASTGGDEAYGQPSSESSSSSPATLTRAPPRRPRPARARSAPETAEPSRARSVPTSTRPASPSTETGASPRLTATAVPEPRRHAHAPIGRRQRSRMPRRAGPRATRRSAIRSRTRCRIEPGSARWASTLWAARSPNGSHGRAPSA